MVDETAPMSWAEVLDRLRRARVYWLATVSTLGAPHVAPIWGVVLGPSLHLLTERSTIKARNQASDPRVAVHLGESDDVTIVYGTLVDAGDPRRQPTVLAAFDAKYDGPGEAAYLPSAPGSTADALYRLSPERALTWSLEEFEGSQRRWRADEG